MGDTPIGLNYGVSLEFPSVITWIQHFLSPRARSIVVARDVKLVMGMINSKSAVQRCISSKIILEDIPSFYSRLSQAYKGWIYSATIIQRPRSLPAKSPPVPKY
jgi:hypothetical protein